jgi:hypothetical protein
MKPTNSTFTDNCLEKTVIAQTNTTAYQKALQFGIFIKATWERKLAPHPVGFD